MAEQVFFENGFADTTMQMIAARAGASKETLYRHFGSKEELFAEIVETRARGFLDSLDAHFDEPGAVRQVLREVGINIIERLVSPNAVNLCRMVVAEAPRATDLGRIFLEEGPYRVRRRLTEFLAAARDRGELDCPDPVSAATLFLGALISTIHLERLVLPSPPTVSPAEVRAHVEEAVGLVLARYAPR